MYQVAIQKCNGCGVCVDTCEVGAIYLINHQAHIDTLLCNACGKCVSVCPAMAIWAESAGVPATRSMVNTSVRPSLLAVVKSILGAIGSAVVPILISKIGDSLTTKLEPKNPPSTASKTNLRDHNRGVRKRYRGGSA